MDFEKKNLLTFSIRKENKTKKKNILGIKIKLVIKIWRITRFRLYSQITQYSNGRVKKFINLTIL